MENKKLRVTCTASKLVALNDLVPFQGELKSLGKNEYEKLKKSILRYGISFPFFLWKNKGKLKVLDGHQRERVLLQMRDEGYQIPKLPAEFIEAKNEKEAKEKILLLSSQYGKLTEESLHEFIVEAELDFPELKEVLDLPQVNLDHFEKGWMTDEVDEDEAPEPPAEAITQLGELYELETHRLLCGDAMLVTDVEKLMLGEKISMVWTDPPYGVGYQDNESIKSLKARNRRTDGKIVLNDSLSESEISNLIKSSLSIVFGFSVDGCVCYVASPAGTLLPYFISGFNASGFNYKHSLVWVKDRFVFGRCDYHYRHEIILYGWKEGKHFFIDDRSQSSVFDAKRPSSSPDHPTQKPITLVSQMIGNSSKVEQIVCDPFLGSGTTLIAAEQLGRHCYGIEIEPRYVDVCITRYLNLRPDAKILRNGKPVDWKKLVEERDKKSAS